MKASTDHVVFSPVVQAFECLRCHARHAPDLPMAIEQFVSVGKGFTLMHRLCQPKPEPSPQLPLPHTGDDCDPPRNAEAETQGKALDGYRATTWVELWTQLQLALEPHEYAALRQHTEFPLNLRRGPDWDRVADWLAREVGGDPGLLLPRPGPLVMAIECALAAMKLQPGPAEKPKRRPKP